MSRNATRRKGKGKVSKTEQELKYKLEDVQIELDRRCDRILQEAEDSILALKNCLSIQMAKLPTAVRQHKVRPLWEDCQESISRLLAAATESGGRVPLGSKSGASLVSAAKARVGTKRSAVQTISHVSKVSAQNPDLPLWLKRSPNTGPCTLVRHFTQKSRITTGASAAGRSAPITPGAASVRGRTVVAGAMRSARPGGAHARLPTTPGTAMRRARRGEMMLSANGSPLTVAGPRARAVVGTAGSGATASGAGDGKASHGASARASSPVADGEDSHGDGDDSSASSRGSPEGIAIDVALSDGMAVNVSDPSALAGLQGEDRARAVQQLMELQAKLASIMGTLQEGKGGATVTASGSAVGGAAAGSSD